MKNVKTDWCSDLHRIAFDKQSSNFYDVYSVIDTAYPPEQPYETGSIITCIFKDEEIEAQRDEVASPKSHSWSGCFICFLFTLFVRESLLPSGYRNGQTHDTWYWTEGPNRTLSHVLTAQEGGHCIPCKAPWGSQHRVNSRICKRRLCRNKRERWTLFPMGGYGWLVGITPGVGRVLKSTTQRWPSTVPIPVFAGGVYPQEQYWGGNLRLGHLRLS